MHEVMDLITFVYETNMMSHFHPAKATKCEANHARLMRDKPNSSMTLLFCCCKRGKIYKTINYVLLVFSLYTFVLF